MASNIRKSLGSESKSGVWSAPNHLVQLTKYNSPDYKPTHNSFITRSCPPINSSTFTITASEIKNVLSRERVVGVKDGETLSEE